MQGGGGPVRVFYSYSHADEALLNKLRLHLAPLRRRGLIVEWSDRAIDAGGDWAEEIKRNLASADLVLLLISKHFIASEFCYGTEMTAALERDARGEARVVPVILSPCRWLKLPFARLQAVPRDNQAVTASCWVNEDEAFDEVAGQIEVVVEALRAAPAAPHSDPLPRAGEGDARQASRPLAGEEGARDRGKVRAAGAAPKPPPGPQLTLPEPKNGVYIGVDPPTLPDRAVFKDVDAPWCPEMVVIPAGRFLMGSPPDEDGHCDDEGPQHWVTIGRRFAIGKNAVTFAEYDHFSEVTKRQKPKDDGWGRSRQPVIHVSAADAEAYVEWLSRDTGQPYRLPTEAEWEYACRAGTTTPFSFGRTITSSQVNYWYEHHKTVAVGSLPANPWGLREMHGNVWEWVEDVWHDNYSDAPIDGSARTDIAGKTSSSKRVIRGGSWLEPSSNIRSANRSSVPPVTRVGSLGFRVARALS